jgi:Lrp/AsnC family transcriptional regulator of ectoine degradation
VTGEHVHRGVDMTLSPKLDVIDLRILDAIQRDGRITKLALAERVGLPYFPCWLV